MKIYQLYLKEYGEGLHDYEDECEAEGKEEAAEIFAKRLGELNPEAGWDDVNLLPFISEVCPECGMLEEGEHLPTCKRYE